MTSTPTGTPLETARPTSATPGPSEPRDVSGDLELTARIEPFDSFWEGPEEIEKGYRTLFEFYRANYLADLPADRESNVLVVSCGPGYFVDMLVRHGYRNVVGIDSDADKVEHARARKLDCRVERAFPFVAARKSAFDAIVCEQELNHLTKEEILLFLRLCREALKPGGTLVVHALNGANPLVGSEQLAQNFDHYNTFTEYTLRQVLAHSHFEGVNIKGLHLYVFYKNPFNWVAWAAATLLSACFRAGFILYGKSNKIFTKKIAASGRKAA